MKVQKQMLINLTTKLFVMLFCASVTFVILAIVVFPRLEESLDLRVQAMAEILADEAGNPRLAGQDRELRMAAFELSTHSPDFRYLGVLDSAGRTIVQQGEGDLQIALDMIGPGARDTLLFDDGSNRIAVAPLWDGDQPLGHAVYVESAQSTKKAQSLFILVCVLSLLLAGAIAVFNVLRFNSRVTVPVAQLKEHAQAASHGQLLAAQLEGNPLDEIEETVKAFHDLVRKYQQLHTSLSENTSELASVAGQMFGTAREQEVMATEQASATEEIGRTMESLLSSSEKIAQSSQGVLASAQETQSTNEVISSHIQELVSLGHQIGDVLGTIKDIANRADLLALNAALEGTKAGEVGQGFSLVAGEMRRLAESTIGSVGDIKVLVENIGRASQSSVLAMEQGMKLSMDTTDAAQRITLITQQQRSGTEQVMRSIEEITTLLQHGLSGVKQLTSAAEQLSTLSHSMRDTVQHFTHVDDQEGGGVDG